MAHSSIKYFRNEEPILAIDLLLKPLKAWLVLWKVPPKTPRLYSVLTGHILPEGKCNKMLEVQLEKYIDFSAHSR